MALAGKYFFGPDCRQYHSDVNVGPAQKRAPEGTGKQVALRCTSDRLVAANPRIVSIYGGDCQKLIYLLPETGCYKREYNFYTAIDYSAAGTFRKKTVFCGTVILRCESVFARHPNVCLRDE